MNETNKQFGDDVTNEPTSYDHHSAILLNNKKSKLLNILIDVINSSDCSASFKLNIIKHGSLFDTNGNYLARLPCAIVDNFLHSYERKLDFVLYRQLIEEFKSYIYELSQRPSQNFDLPRNQSQNTSTQVNFIENHSFNDVIQSISQNLAENERCHSRLMESNYTAKLIDGIISDSMHLASKYELFASNLIVDIFDSAQNQLAADKKIDCHLDDDNLSSLLSDSYSNQMNPIRINLSNESNEEEETNDTLNTSLYTSSSINSSTSIPFQFYPLFSSNLSVENVAYRRHSADVNNKQHISSSYCTSDNNNAFTILENNEENTEFLSSSSSTNQYVIRRHSFNSIELVKKSRLNQSKSAIRESAHRGGGFNKETQNMSGSILFNTQKTNSKPKINFVNLSNKTCCKSNNSSTTLQSISAYSSTTNYKLNENSKCNSNNKYKQYNKVILKSPLKSIGSSSKKYSKSKEKSTSSSTTSSTCSLMDINNAQCENLATLASSSFLDNLLSDVLHDSFQSVSSIKNVIEHKYAQDLNDSIFESSFKIVNVIKFINENLKHIIFICECDRRDNASKCEDDSCGISTKNLNCLLAACSMIIALSECHFTNESTISL